MDNEDGFIFKELSYGVLGCAFDAFKKVRVGFDEIRYHKVFHEYLLRKNLEAKYKPPIPLDYLGEQIAEMQVDEIVENKLVVELKRIQTEFLPENYAQIMTYLKLAKLRLGFLINFGLHKAYPKRIIFDERRQADTEQWDPDFFPASSLRPLIDAVLAMLKRIDNVLGVAYHGSIYQSAFAVELKRNNLAYDDNVCITDPIESIQFSPFVIDYWLIEKSFLIGILAGKDRPRLYDLLRMRSYLKSLHLHHGLIAYWSVRNLQLYGIHES